MNKKGMTLIELIAVIAIMAILTLMIAPNIMEMRNQAVKTTIKNKIDKIHNAAITYAEANLSNVPNYYTNNKLGTGNLNYSLDSSSFNQKCLTEKTFEDRGPEGNYKACEEYCLIVYVKTLVENGYIAGDNDDKTKIINPYNGANMNEERVCVRYDTDIVEITTAERMDRSKFPRKLIAYIVDEDKLYGSLND